MIIFTDKMKKKLAFLQPILPYGVIEPWDDLNPRLYHAVHIYWLKFYGMWFNNFSPYCIKYWLQMIYTLVVLWLVCFLPGSGEVVYLLRRRQNIGDVAEGLYLFLSEMYTYFKIAVFWLNKNQVVELLKYLHREEFKPREAEHREIIRKSINTARFVMTYYSTMCVGAVSVGIILPLTEHFDILPTNVEYPNVDIYKTPTYVAAYIHHIYYKPATCIIDGAMDTILAAFVASAIGQIEILAFNLRNFELIAERRRKNFKNKKRIEEYTKQYHMQSILKECIIHHNCIIRDGYLAKLVCRQPKITLKDWLAENAQGIKSDDVHNSIKLYVSMIESAFSLASALQFMLSVMVLCLIGVQFLSIENPASHPMQMVWMGIYLTCMLIEVFILCWFGNELIWKSIDLRQAAFDGPWTTSDRKTNIYIILFMERCKRPLCVRAGKIFTLSLDTYTILINWAYKAFAVMSNMKK